MELYYPDDKEMLYYIGDWSYHAFQWPTSVEYFEKVLTVDPTHEQTLFHLATAYARTNQHDKVQSLKLFRISHPARRSGFSKYRHTVLRGAFTVISFFITVMSFPSAQ